MQDIVSMLRGMDPAQLSDAVARAKAYMETPQGRQALEKLRRGQPVEGLPVTTEEQNRLIARLTGDPAAVRRLEEMLNKK